MAKKYYAIAKGKSGIPKIVETWTECQKEVIGCKGAKYKSFTSKEEAGFSATGSKYCFHP